MNRKLLFAATAGLLGVALVGEVACTPPKTANPNALPEAQALLTYFGALPSRKVRRVVSGQFIGHAAKVGQTKLIQSLYDKYVTELHRSTGQWVALVGADYARLAQSNDPVDLSLTNQVLISHWRKGGLVTISWHARNPWTGGNSRDKTIGSPFSNLITPGTAANASWMAQLNQVADALAELQNAGVVVLWRPLHEMNGDGFWWGQRTQGEFIGLWRHMFRHFTEERKLNNLLWIYSTVVQKDKSIKPEDTYLPGSEFFDMAGVDTYTADVKIEKAYGKLTVLGKPFWLTEFGPFKGSNVTHDYDYTRLINQIKSRYPKTTAFQCWNSDWAMVAQRNARFLLEDPWVITLEDLDWRILL